MKIFFRKNRLKKALRLSLISLGMMFLCSCPNPEPPPSLSGTILDAETDKPVSGAGVKINNVTLTTVEDGYYEFKEIGSGKFPITVTHPDYETREENVTVNDRDLAYDVRINPLKYSLSGTVVESGTNKILAGVTITATSEGGGTQEKTSGTDGTYTFDNVKKGRLTLSFAKDGYKSKSEQVTIPETVSLTTALEPYISTLIGTVTSDRNNQPISGVSVSNGDGATVMTNSNGVYQFADLRKTSYTISASKTGFKNFAATNVPINREQASNTFDFAMTPTTTSLSGKALDSRTGAALSGVTVTLSSVGSVTTGSDGSYRFDNLTQTSYTIRADKSGYNSFSASVSVSLDLEDNTYNIQLEENPTTSLVGTVTDSQTGATLSGVTVTLSSVGSVTTGSGGTYRFDNLTQTSYTLSASRSGYQSYSASVSVNLSVAANTRNISLTPTQTTSSAKVSFGTVMSISDGITAELTFSSATSRHIVHAFKTATVASMSDAGIITVLQTSSSAPTTYNLKIFYDLDASSSYTLCAVGLDASGRAGTLTRYAISTKSAISQPRAVFTGAYKTGNNVYLAVSPNSYCSSYRLWLGSYTYDSSDPDAYFAYLAYADGDVRSSGTSGTVPINYSYSHTLLVTLGYTSSGSQSGVVDVKIIRNSDGYVVRSAQVDVRSLGKEGIKMLESGKMDGRLKKILFTPDE